MHVANLPQCSLANSRQSGDCIIRYLNLKVNPSYNSHCALPAYTWYSVLHILTEFTEFLSAPE